MQELNQTRHQDSDLCTKVTLNQGFLKNYKDTKSRPILGKFVTFLFQLFSDYATKWDYEKSWLCKKRKKKKFFLKEKIKTCLLSFSGNPLPRLTWYKSGSLIDETYDILSNGTVRNEITFHSIERSFLRTKLTCEASNTNLTRPTSTTVNVDMNCKFYKNTRMAEPWSWPRPQPNVMAFFIILNTYKQKG